MFKTLKIHVIPLTYFINKKEIGKKMPSENSTIINSMTIHLLSLLNQLPKPIVNPKCIINLEATAQTRN